MNLLKQKWLYCFLAAFLIFVLWMYLSNVNFFRGFEQVGALIALIIIEMALIGGGMADLIISIIPKKNNDDSKD